MLKKKKYNFWKRLHFKYRVSIINENTLEHIWKIRASLFSGGLLILFFAISLITITSVIIITTPIRYYLPGYLDSEIRDKALRSAIQIDSLEQQIGYMDVYNANIRNILGGNINVDSINTVLDTISLSENDPLLQKSKLVKGFVKKYEEEEKYNLSVLPQTNANMPMEGILFFKPVNGVISEKYAPELRKYGISVKISGRETVSSVQDGTIIYAKYDTDDGYTVQIQHKSGFVSSYKHVGILLKDVGTRVKTGEAIGVIDNTDKNMNKVSDCLYFELWFRGNSVNPVNYIFF